MITWRMLIPTALIATLLVVLVAVGVMTTTPNRARAQVQAGVALAVQPLTAPITIAPRATPYMRFAGEAVNTGAPLPNNPNRVVVEGRVRMSPSTNATSWHLLFERLTLDSAVIATGGPLAELQVYVDHTVPGRRDFSASMAGLRGSPYMQTPGAFRILRAVLDTTAHALYAAPAFPISDRTPVIDVNAALHRHISYTINGAQLVQPAPPAFAAGTLRYQETPSLLLLQTGPFVVRAFGVDTVMNSEAQAVLDIGSAVPLFLQARLTADARLPFVNGRIEYMLRVALAYEGMPDPLATLAVVGTMATPQPAAAIDEGAGRRQPAARFPGAPAAAPASKPAPAASAPKAPSSDAANRLRALKNLYDQGLITKEQYDERQKEILKAL